MKNREEFKLKHASLIEEFTQAAMEYTEACKETVRQEGAIVQARKHLAAVTEQMERHEDDIENWSSDNANTMSSRIEVIASLYKAHAEHLHVHAGLLNVLDEVISKIKHKVKLHDGN